MARTVRLREERHGRDRRSLWAHCDENGCLVIEGQDLGPATAAISSEGEYQWSFTFRPDSIPALSAALHGDDGEDILDLLERKYTQERSYELERIVRDTKSAIPRDFWSWSG